MLEGGDHSGLDWQVWENLQLSVTPEPASSGLRLVEMFHSSRLLGLTLLMMEYGSLMKGRLFFHFMSSLKSPFMAALHINNNKY